ncbi:hypothetical protein G4L39_11065 [Limisphaera ngatamarikiensis]|uniref:Uncharacterized protein n=1 Tax=Limisphaera ngatamarikiensis TaxID=1324935 RepID=A0A6M1RJN8_9BACT|nr:hypothetical protein [Limisphaera ngatamarikiensis]NGO39926.1 hypothetical protein [Limisphaera ngatamarikiensis]
MSLLLGLTRVGPAPHGNREGMLGDTWQFSDLAEIARLLPNGSRPQSKRCKAAEEVAALGLMVARWRSGFINLDVPVREGRNPTSCTFCSWGCPNGWFLEKNAACLETFIDLLAPWWETSQFL